jgi:heme-degrading monooxygenase HmoA
MTAIIRSITDAAPRGSASHQALRGDTAHRQRASTQVTESTVVVFSSFLVSPGEVPTWIHSWHGLAATAETWSGCRSFRLVRDRNDDMYMAAFSEWDNLDAYRSFMHATGDRWQHGGMGHTIMAGESRFLETIGEESPLQAAY